MNNYKIKVPVTTYHETSISVENLINILEQEQKGLCGRWDTIREKSNGEYVYFNRGYGSHDIGEEDGDKVDEAIVDAFLSVEKVKRYLRTKNK